MNGDSNKNLESNYEVLHGLIRSIAKKIAGIHAPADLIEDLEAEGWMIACEAMREYSPERGKVTTYLWTALNGGMMRFASRRCRELKVVKCEENVLPLRSTESVSSSGLYMCNPYRMQPDAVLEKVEKQDLARQVWQKHDEEIRDILEKTPKFSDFSTRQSISRYRKRKLQQIQATVKMMLSETF